MKSFLEKGQENGPVGRKKEMTERAVGVQNNFIVPVGKFLWHQFEHSETPKDINMIHLRLFLKNTHTHTKCPLKKSMSRLKQANYYQENN